MCVPRLQDSAKKAKHKADNAKKRTRDSADKHSAKKKVEQSKGTTKESKESKGASHQKPSMAKESPDTQHEKSNDEKRALNKFMNDLKKLNSEAEPRKIKVKGVMGESTVGFIGFTCTFDGEEQEHIVHENEIGADEKRDFALAVARWIRDDGQAKHKAGVVRALDLMLDSLLGKSDVPRLEALFHVQEPRGRNSTFRCSIAHPSHIRTKKKKTPRPVQVGFTTPRTWRTTRTWTTKGTWTTTRRAWCASSHCAKMKARWSCCCAKHALTARTSSAASCPACPLATGSARPVSESRKKPA